jgi:uncharacterized protein (TIGR03435 family)
LQGIKRPIKSDYLEEKTLRGEVIMNSGRVFVKSHVHRSSTSLALKHGLAAVKALCLVVSIVFGNSLISFALTALPGTQAGQTANVARRSTIVANWQGTLHVGHDMRLVLKITQQTDGALQSALYSADPGGMGVPVKTTTMQDSQLSLNVESFGAKYVGRLSADGNSISGTWQQAGQSLSLDLVRATPETEWHLPEPPKKILAMAADLHPSFEVATIKQSEPGSPSKMFRLEGRRFFATGMSVADLISFAYGLQAQQVVDGPEWLTTDKFDVAGQPDAEGQPSERQLKEMVQRLLADRFQLKFHHSEKQLNAYVLEVPKDGPKLTKSTGDPNGTPTMYFTKVGSLVVSNATIKEFTALMQSAVFDRPMIDDTGIQGRWNFTLNWTPDESQFAGYGAKVPPPSDAADAPPSIFKGIQEQIGLKLDSRKTLVNVIVLEKVARPSQN